MGGTILYTESNFDEPWKMYNLKTITFSMFVLECIIASYD